MLLFFHQLLNHHKSLNPDVYEIGMSHLGMQILYHDFNRYDDVWCERVFSPWMDLDKVMREQNIPLFALESQDPIKDFDFVGFTLQYEMCYTNILQVLDLAGIPLLTKDRGENDPIIIGGGPCVYNPEPIADFFDMFYIGEGEVQYRPLFDLYKKCKKDGITLILSHVCEQPLAVMKKAELVKAIGEDNLCANIDAALARAASITE